MMNLQLPEDEPYAFEGQAMLALLLYCPSSTLSHLCLVEEIPASTFAHAVPFTISHVFTWVTVTFFF